MAFYVHKPAPERTGEPDNTTQRYNSLVSNFFLVD